MNIILMILGIGCIIGALLTLSVPFISKNKEPKGKSTVYNPQVRYDLESKQYFIVNADPRLGDIPYKTWYGRKILFKSKSLAQVAVENMK